MKVSKAVVTAASPKERALPLQRFVDRDGVDKTALRIILEEVIESGVEEIALVICPGDGPVYSEAAGPHIGRLHFIEQNEPRGYADAVFRAADFTAGQPFVHLVSDHLYATRGKLRCARQLIDVAEKHNCAVSAVQATREHQLSHYGTIGGTPVPQSPRLFEVTDVAEKPTPTEAEQRLLVPGLRAGHYLCLFGMHVLTPSVMDILREQVESNTHRSLSPALAKLAQRERFLALQVEGVRYNLGIAYGALVAQLALALDGEDREQVLAQLVELLAGRL
ncbi:MAG: UTP--glucose-1-phosphate uridylyltransferase [Phycisphaera sp.]|nr:UTP--glucose-1-phosphate uridylyltransferase [Phycisphaera sp.]